MSPSMRVDDAAAKPVLKQFLIKPSENETDGQLLGLKCSDSELEKLKCEECSFQVSVYWGLNNDPASIV